METVCAKGEANQTRARRDQRAVTTRAPATAPLAAWAAASVPTWAEEASPPALFNPVPGLQAKLTVNEPGDVYEQEADRVAEQVMRMPEPSGGQQRCACGGLAGPDGECAACKAKRLGVQRRASAPTAPTEAPPLVHEVLRQPGQPLDTGTRTWMESRFGHDFSGVRLHTGDRAAQSAAAVGARAYTVGPSVVFGAGEYAPGTGEGRQLLAHELAHVVQQRSDGVARLQRLDEACPARPAGEAAQSRSPGGILSGNVQFSESARQLDIMDFAVNSADLPPVVTNSMDWQRAMSLMAGDPTIRIQVAGYTDCAGNDAENVDLRRQRIQSVIDVMPAEVQRKILFSFVMSARDYLATNTTAEGRARNRSVRVTFMSIPPRGQQACDQLTRASTLDEYLFLVRCLEQRLGLTAASDTRTALSVLRQIYFGAAGWSASRNPVWNDVIPTRPWSPGTNPQPQLGPALFNALQASQVVGGTDVGHLFTGIEAMLAPQEVAVSMGRISFQTSLANEEWATWAGDVGSAAVEWTFDTFQGRATGNRAAYFQRFASDADLVGDLDAFAMRAGFNVGSAPPQQLMQTIRLRGPLSEALLQYFRLSGTSLGRARGRSVQTFVEAYGGTIANNTITNRAAFTARLRPSVENFAGLLGLQRTLQLPNNAQPPPGVPALNVLMQTAIDDMTRRFVDWLDAHL